VSEVRVDTIEKLETELRVGQLAAFEGYAHLYAVALEEELLGRLFTDLVIVGVNLVAEGVMEIEIKIYKIGVK